MNSAKKTINVLLIDENTNDFPIFLTALAEIESSALCENPIELFYTPSFSTALAQLKKLELHLILMGHPLPYDCSEDAIADIRALAPNAQIVAVAKPKHEKLAKAAAENGAHGYWVKGKHTGLDLSKFIEMRIS